MNTEGGGGSTRSSARVSCARTAAPSQTAMTTVAVSAKQAAARFMPPLSLCIQSALMANEIDALLQENRTFPPHDEFRRHANAKDESVYDVKDREAYWADWASQLDWQTKWNKVLDWNPPYAKWFVGGTLNASYNCLDRHLATRGDKLAVIWEGEPGDVRTFTYRQLHAEVSKFANVLKSLGVQLGDRVAIYMPLVPEAVVAMLACARIGAIHSVVFGGFSAEALRDRINDAEAKILITATAG